jgi:hypothetical protein
MTYQVAVYFDGPRSRWSKRLHESEVIYLTEVPWLWLARYLGRANCGNTGRASYVITRGEEIIENTNPAALQP